MNRQLLFALLSLFGFFTQARTDEKIRISSYEVKGITESDLSGDYDRVILKILQEIGGDIIYRTRPTSRANQEFERRETDCIFPVDIRFYSSKSKLVNSLPVNVAKIYIYSREGEGPWHSLDQIKGKRIGIKSGVPLGPKWNSSGLKAEKVKKDSQNIRKLNDKRIDAFLAFVPDMNVFQDEKKYKMPIFDQTRPLDTHNEALLCYESEKIKHFLKKFDHKIEQYRKDGTLKALLGRSFVQ